MPNWVFIAYDFQIGGLLLDNLDFVAKNPPTDFQVDWAGDPKGRRQGEIWRDKTRPGIERAAIVLGFMDLPNANVGFELGYALGKGKQVGFAWMTGERPDWLTRPPFGAFLASQLVNPREIRERILRPDWVSVRAAQRAGEAILLLCPHRAGGALHDSLEGSQEWEVVPPHGWNLHDFPEKLEGVGLVVWLIVPPVEGPAGRDGAENAALSVIAGYAAALPGVELTVLAHSAARPVADLEGQIQRFASVNDVHHLLDAAIVAWRDRAPERLYRRRIIDRTSKLRLLLSGFGDPVVTDLHKMFVPPKVFLAAAQYDVGTADILENAESNQQAPAGVGTETVLGTSAMRRTDSAVDIGEALRLGNHWMVTGDSGSGKTTLLKYLALAFAEERLDEQRLPLLVHLAEFARFLERSDLSGRVALHTWLINVERRPGNTNQPWVDLVNRKIAAGQCAILMDGLDEVTDEELRMHIARCIGEFASDKETSGNRIIFTSRPRVLAAGQGTRAVVRGLFREAVLFPMEMTAVETYARNYLEAIGQPLSDDAGRVASDLVQGWSRDPLVKEMVRNPLMCSVLTAMHREDRMTLRTQTEILKECWGAMLASGPLLDNHRNSRVHALLAAEPRFELTGQLALWFHERGVRQAHRPEIEVHIAEHLVRKSWCAPDVAGSLAGEFIDLLADCAQLLVRQDNGSYVFAHSAFQEFFAARGVIDRGDWLQYTSQRLHLPGWTEVIVFEMGHLCLRPVAASVKIQYANQLLQAVYDPDRPPTDGSTSHRLQLALRVMAQATSRTLDPTVCAKLMARYVEFATPAMMDLPGADLLLKDIASRLASSNPADQSLARAALERLGSSVATPDLLQALIDLSAGDSRDLCCRALAALGDIGPAALTPAVKAQLEVLQQHADRTVRGLASMTLTQLRMEQSDSDGKKET